VTRDYVIDRDDAGPPLLSVYGGKLTTYRRLAEDVVGQLAPSLGCAAGAWTAGTVLPGGDLPRGNFDAYLAALVARRPDWPEALLRRYARAYGTRIERLIGNARTPAELGPEVLPGLHEREIEYLRREEWAVTADDILYRRSKLALHAPPDGASRLAAWLAGHPASVSSA
jgi:glycerol-3-phosphate dehydrogenase